MELSLATARRAVAQLDPRRRVARVERPAGSARGRVFELHADDGSPPLVLKLFDPGAAWQLAQEILVYERLRTVGVPVPEMSRLPGQVVASLEPDAREAREIYREIGATLRAIHSIGLARFGYFGRSGPIDGFETNRAFVAAWLERDLRRFAEAGGPAPLVARVERRGAAIAPLLDACREPVLCEEESRIAFYALHHALELWVWFARARDTARAAEIAADLDRLAAPA